MNAGYTSPRGDRPGRHRKLKGWHWREQQCRLLDPHQKQPYWYVPTDLPRARTDWTPRGCRSRMQCDTSQGTFAPDVWEFVQAIERARKQKGVPLTAAEHFEVMWGLGYRRTKKGPAAPEEGDRAGA